MDGGHKKGSSRFSEKGRSGGGSRIARLPRRYPFRGGYRAAVGSGPGGAPLGRECPGPLAIRLPASFPQRLRGMIRGRPACWRILALWCWDIRLPASFPQRLRGMICGRPACWRILALWCWDIRLPASFPQRLRGMICGRPACWRILALWCWDICLPASFPQRLRGRSVGAQLAGE